MGSKWCRKRWKLQAVTSPHGCSGIWQQLKLLPYLQECFCHPFLVMQPDSIKYSVCRLSMRSSAAADEARQTMTTTWESHWNAESQRTCDCMLSGKTIPNSCKCVVSTPGHVLRNWRSHMCFLRLFSFHPVPHRRETVEAVEAGFNHLGLSVWSWASLLCISHLQLIHPYDLIKTIHHCSLNQDRWDPESNFREWANTQHCSVQWQETQWMNTCCVNPPKQGIALAW